MRRFWMFLRRSGSMPVRALLLALTAVCVGGLLDVAAAQLGVAPEPPGLGQQTPGGTPCWVIVHPGNFLSVHVQDAPWEAVLQEIVRQTDLTIRVEGPLPGTLTDAFERLPLAQGLRRLFRDANQAFLYAKETTAGPAGTRLTHVWLFPRAASAVRRATRSPLTSCLGDQAPPPAAPIPGEDGQTGKALETLALQGKAEALQQAILTQAPNLQAAALERVAELHVPEAVVVLDEATRSEQQALRLQALHLLQQSRYADTGTVLSALRQALADEDLNVKGYALSALAERGGPEALELLLQALHDPNPVIRQMIIEGIAPGVPEDLKVPLLQEALSDDDEVVRSLAASELQHVVGEGE